MDGNMRHISITVPSVSANTMNMSSPRVTITRQSVQTALNRSIPAQGQDDEDYTSPRNRNRAPSPRLVRTAPTTGLATGAATNEFIGRTRTGPSRQPAKTNIVNFQGVPLKPRERQNVRGIDGFFPPLRMKSGGGSGKFAVSESISTAWAPRPGQEHDHVASSQPFNVELAPHHSEPSLGPDSVPHNQPNIDWLQRRNNGMVINHNSLTTDTHGHSQSDHAHAASPKAPRRSRSPPTPEVTGLQQQRKKDAAWVRAFKVKQNRNNRYRDMDLGSKSMTNLEEGSKRWGLPD